MKNEFVKYEQALALRELGFDEPCLFHTLKGEINFYNPFSLEYNIGVSAILCQQAFRWFREKHNLCGEVYTVNMGAIDYTFQIRDLYSEDIKHDNFEANTGGYIGTFLTYEEAELECLKHLIKVVKEKNND